MKTLILIISMASSLTLAAGEPDPFKAQPGEAAKNHVEEISAAQHKYTVVQGGTLDGRSCRSPSGVGLNREGCREQTWESNRAVRMENTGETDVVNPWLSNGRNNFRSMDEIVASVTTKDMTDKEKARALWFLWIANQYHYGDGDDMMDPVKVINVYGYHGCGKAAICMAGVWSHAGLKAAPVRCVGHCISQVFYDGRWHLMDGNYNSIFLMRDNETVASDMDVARDHDLVKRSHNDGILWVDNRGYEEFAASKYVYEGEVTGQRDSSRDGTMKMTLRPGEALTWKWGNRKPVKHHSSDDNVLYPQTISNGLWEYRPDFTKEIWKKGAASVDGIKSGPEGLAAEEGKTGTIVWALRSPYVFVGGKIETEGSGAKFAISFDGKAWQDVSGSFDKLFPPRDPSHYTYQIRCTLAAGAQLKRLAIINDLQMATLALPEMGLGENAFVYSDESKGARKVRVSHEWVERSDLKAPEAPPAAISPADGGESEGTDIVFQWKAPADPTGIADYQFELSDRPDMKWPLSTNFYKLISRTADAGKAQYTLPYAGLLNADKQYHWRVRAKNKMGVWGAWSKTWNFTPRGANCPIEIAVAYDQAKRSATLKWKPQSTGRKPAAYRIYGSDEKGFSISDQPYAVNVGGCKELTNPFLANFIAEAKSTELELLGAQPYRTYYRVVAVDEKGKRSGPSDYVVAPRPMIYSKPVSTGRVGSAYSYAILANRSIGDLTDRGSGASFWEIEKPKFTLAKGPDWLKIDAATGVLSGTPSAEGKFDVEVSVAIDREVRKLDPGVLSWGNEKVLATTVEKLGPGTQQFSITVEK